MSTAAAQPSPELHALAGERQKRMLARLRFPPEIERRFRIDHEAGATASRVTLQLLAIFMVAITPLYDQSLLHAPASFLPASRVLQFQIQIPFTVLALITTLWRPLRALSAVATGIATVIVALGLMTQRVIGMRHGFEVPFDFGAVTLAAGLFLARLRLRYYLPWALLTMLATTAAELLLVSAGQIEYGLMSAWMLFLIATAGGYVLEYSSRQSWCLRQLLSYQAARDPLTGLVNRREFDRRLHELVRNAARERGSVALLLIDVDHFKAYNDHFGHPRGDDCLRRIGLQLERTMRRPHDFCARIGGEEFAAVWANARPEDAVRLAEALRDSIAGLGIEAPPARGSHVTASGGLAQLLMPSPAEDAGLLCTRLLSVADAALYRAKAEGRARLVSSDALGASTAQA